MSNKTITAVVRRNGRKSWAGKCLRTARMLIIACATVIALPGVAQAQLWKSNGCRGINGANIQLIPAVNFTLGTLPAVGTEVYRTTTYVINYECSYYNEFDKPYPPGVTIPQLQALGGFQTLNEALERAGLGLQIVVNGDEGHPWKPSVLVSAGNVSEFRAIGPAYQGVSGPRTLTLVAKLVVKNNHPPAARYPVPAQIIFRVMPTVGAGSDVAQVSITNTATRMQFVPQCIGAVSVENGLKMQILDNQRRPVKILPAFAPPLREDVGNFGQLAGNNPAAMIHTYTASLASDAGKELKLGKYSTQVLVKVSYY